MPPKSSTVKAVAFAKAEGAVRNKAPTAKTASLAKTRAFARRELKGNYETVNLELGEMRECMELFKAPVTANEAGHVERAHLPSAAQVRPQLDALRSGALARFKEHYDQFGRAIGAFKKFALALQFREVKEFYMRLVDAMQSINTLLVPTLKTRIGTTEPPRFNNEYALQELWARKPQPNEELVVPSSGRVKTVPSVAQRVAQIVKLMQECVKGTYNKLLEFVKAPGFATHATMIAARFHVGNEECEGEDAVDAKYMETNERIAIVADGAAVEHESENDIIAGVKDAGAVAGATVKTDAVVDGETEEQRSQRLTVLEAQRWLQNGTNMRKSQINVLDPKELKVRRLRDRVIDRDQVALAAAAAASEATTTAANGSAEIAPDEQQRQKKPGPPRLKLYKSDDEEGDDMANGGGAGGDDDSDDDEDDREDESFGSEDCDAPAEATHADGGETVTNGKLKAVDENGVDSDAEKTNDTDGDDDDDDDALEYDSDAQDSDEDDDDASGSEQGSVSDEASDDSDDKASVAKKRKAAAAKKGASNKRLRSRADATPDNDGDSVTIVEKRSLPPLPRHIGADVAAAATVIGALTVEPAETIHDLTQDEINALF